MVYIYVLSHDDISWARPRVCEGTSFALNKLCVDWLKKVLKVEEGIEGWDDKK